MVNINRYTIPYHQVFYGGIPTYYYKVIADKIYSTETVPLSSVMHVFPYSAPTSFPYLTPISVFDYPPYYPPLIYPYFPEE